MHRLESEEPKDLRLDLQEGAACGFDRLDTFGGDETVDGRVAIAPGGFLGQ
jgi:hypothetical protein